MDIINILDGYTATTLRRLAIYLSEFQKYDFIEPFDKRCKQGWVGSIRKMSYQKETSVEYIFRIVNIIKWLQTHKFIFRKGMANSASFYNKITQEFTRNVTSTVIHFENGNHESIDILKSDIIFSDDINKEFERNPNTINCQINTVNTVPPDEEPAEETKGLECKVCLINKICIVLQKCGHTFCYTCTTRIDNKCATCRTPFTKNNIIRMYI